MDQGDRDSQPGVNVGVREGDVIARKYRVGGMLGAGGMGAVFAAHHLDLDERVAIKFLLPDALMDAGALARFAREARIAVKIKSEHVARIIDVGTLPNGAPFMVMEYLEGQDLEEWLLLWGPLPIDQAVEFVLQASVAVAEAHALGIVHRDLKPANLFCIRRPDGQLSIKVLDFGISKLTEPAALGAGANTRTASFLGSPLYMSPEQMRSARDVDALSDIWALGVILFELVAGTAPFNAQTVTELAIKVHNEATPSVRAHRPEIPTELEAVIRRCLEKERAKRYRNVAELAAALLPFAPPRARVSVERILGTIAAGRTALASTPPPPASSANTPRPQTLRLGGSPPAPMAVARTLASAVWPAPSGDAPAEASARSAHARERSAGGTGSGRWAAVATGAASATVVFVAAAALTSGQRGSPSRDPAPVSVSATAAEAPPELSSAVLVPLDPEPTTQNAPSAEEPSPSLPSANSFPPAPQAAAMKKVLPANAPPRQDAAAPAPCNLIKTLDAYGEPHFSCPCEICQ
ncbi:MAG: protein kinase [Polyangiaceae bacterium]|nr:protein kinase [Polyangiaceae bacterium]